MLTEPLTPSKQASWHPPFALCIYMVAVASVTGAGCSKPKPTPSESESPKNVVAMVGDEPITAEQFAVESTNRHTADNPAAKKAQLDEMIHTRLLGQEARRRGYDQDPQVIAAFDKLLADRMQQEIRPRTKAGSQEIEAYYKAHAGEFMTPTAVRSAVIFVAAPAQAPAEVRAAKRATMDTIRQRAMELPPNTTGFGPLATQYSDDQETKLKGGDMGFFVEGHADPKWEKPVIDAALALSSPNQLSDMVATDRGYYLVKLTARHSASPRHLESVRTQIEKSLADEKERQFVADLVKAAENNHIIKVFDDRLATTPVRDASSDPTASRQPSPSAGR